MCGTSQESHQTAYVLVTEVPVAEWLEVRIKEKYNLVVINYHSDLPEMALQSNMSSSFVIIHAKSISATNGRLYGDEQ